MLKRNSWPSRRIRRFSKPSYPSETETERTMRKLIAAGASDAVIERLMPGHSKVAQNKTGQPHRAARRPAGDKSGVVLGSEL
jgi:hypothetical protein